MFLKTGYEYKIIFCDNDEDLAHLRVDLEKEGWIKDEDVGNKTTFKREIKQSDEGE